MIVETDALRVNVAVILVFRVSEDYEKTARSREAIHYINTAYLICLLQKQLDEG